MSTRHGIFSHPTFVQIAWVFGVYIGAVVCMCNYVNYVHV